MALAALTAALLGAGPAGAAVDVSARTCSKRTAQAHLNEVRAARSRPDRLLCFDFTRDRRRDMVFSVVRRGATNGATSWVALRRRRAGGWRVAGRGSAWGGRSSRRGRLRIARRGRDVLVTVPVWRAGDSAACPTGGLRRRLYRWRSGRLRTVRRSRV